MFPFIFTFSSTIVPFSIKGMLWYQGESNQSVDYLNKYMVFMECIRDEFKCPDMKFYAVELASYCLEETAPDEFISGNNWAFTREQQQKATELAKNNYLVTSMELGDICDVHPIQKKELAKRIYMKILKHSYNFNIFAEQPTFKSAEFKNGKAYIYLNNADGLYSNNLSTYCLQATIKTPLASATGIAVVVLVLKNNSSKATSSGLKVSISSQAA